MAKALGVFGSVLSLLSRGQRATFWASMDLLRRHRAVLLSEATGAGKTYVACAMASVYQAQTGKACVLVAPAHLLPVWGQVVREFPVRMAFYSYQMASLGRIPACEGEDALWLLDEAHGLKNRQTKRYVFLQRLLARHRVCLITATPVNLGWGDLCALMGLCGLREEVFEASWLASFASALMPQSRVRALTTETRVRVHREEISYEIAEFGGEFSLWMAHLASMEWPFQTASGGIQSMPLLAHVLMHRLLSHRVSCLKTLERLERYYASSLCCGQRHMLSRGEFRRWMGLDGRQRLLPFEEPIFGRPIAAAEAETIRETLHRVRMAVARMRGLQGAVDGKMEALRSDLRAHVGEKTVVFTQYADTAEWVARGLWGAFSVALLTSEKALWHGQETTPEVIYAMFDPHPTRERAFLEGHGLEADILVCSDAFSCGHNFQRATRCIHFDLPWNPTTFVQREGRVNRRGQVGKDLGMVTFRLCGGPACLLGYEAQLCDVLKARMGLQRTWGFEAHGVKSDAYLLADHAYLPQIWGRCGTTWVPVAPTRARKKIWLRRAELGRATTLGEAFCGMLVGLRRRMKPLWDALKRQRYAAGGAAALRGLSQFTYQVALFNQLWPEGSWEEDWELSQLEHLPLASLPPPSTRVWIVDGAIIEACDEDLDGAS